MKGTADMIFEKGLPANPDAERLVLGSIQLNGELYPDVAGVLVSKDFSLEKHRRIFARMRDLYERGEKIDRVTLANELQTQGQIESVDGFSYLASLDEGMPALANIDSYIRIVKEKSILRQGIFTCQGIIDQCANAQDGAEDILASATAVLERVRESGASSRAGWATAYDVARTNLDTLFPTHHTAGGIRTPWPRLTEMTSGFSPGDLVVVAGRPSMGKSVIGMQQALTTAQTGTAIAFVSLEMSKPSLVRRLISGIARVDAHRARSGFLDADERRRALEAAADLENLPLNIDDSGIHTPAGVSAAVRRLRARAKVGLVVIDHLQLMRVTGRAESRHGELGEIVHGFKRLAVQMECVVMILSQLNRTCEQERRRPTLADLKECGAIEEDADTVLFIHRPEMYKRDDPSLRGQAELIVAKQRNGPTGKIPLTFQHGYQIFEETGREVEENA
jgi:replicative DNA helicase